MYSAPSFTEFRKTLESIWKIIEGMAIKIDIEPKAVDESKSEPKAVDES